MWERQQRVVLVPVLLLYDAATSIRTSTALGPGSASSAATFRCSSPCRSEPCV
jgi:hypothetical protein